MLKSPKEFLSFRFPNHNLYAFVISYATYPAQLILLDLLILIIYSEEYKLRSSSLHNFLQSHLLLSLS
jgi:hypothetical protein